MRHGGFGVLALLVGALGLSGCAPAQPVADESGLTESEALGMSLEEQYGLAGERYRELNERVAELQGEIFEDEWEDGSVSSELIPGQGYTIGGALEGDTRENSYYFTMSRWHQTDQDLKTLLRGVARSWEARGWEVGEETSQISGEIRVVATTDDGFWFAASEEQDTLKLRGDGPVYWGDQRGLSGAIAERRDAEDAAGAPWDTTDRDDEGDAYRLPGVYRPFPAW